MPKTDTITFNSDNDSTLSAPSQTPAIRLGGVVTVKVAPGLQLIDNETGQLFAADTPTPATVTVTLLRRLADGDLVLA